MVCVELEFSDDQRRLRARQVYRQRLAELHDSGAVLAAGPWDDDSGALIVFELGWEQVRAELDTDPFYRAAGVTVVSIREWSPVIGP